MLLIGFSFGALLEERLALVRRWRLPVRCWWAWLQTVIRGGAVSDCQYCAGGVGALGVPILVAGQVTGIDPFPLAQWRDVSYRSCRFLCRSGGSNDGRLERGERDVASGAGCGGSFAVTQFFTSNYIGPELRILLRRW